MTNKHKLNFYDASIILVSASLMLPIQFGSIAVAILGIAFFISGKPFLTNDWKNNPVSLLLVVYYIFHIAGILWSDNTTEAYRELEYKLSFLVFPLLIGASDHFKSFQLKLATRSFSLAAVTLLIVSYLVGFYRIIFENKLENKVEYFVYQYLANPLDFQPIYMALYLVSAFFFIWFDNFITTFLPKQKWLKPALLLFLFAGIVMLSSRMEILVFWLVLSLVLLYEGFTRKIKILNALGIWGGLALLTFLLIKLSPENSARFQEAAAVEKHYSEEKWGGRAVRLEKWKNTWELIKENPILGTGTGDMKKELMATYTKNDFLLGVEHQFNPHNQYLQTWVSLGIFALAILLILFAILFFKSFRLNQLMSASFVLIVTLSMLTESMLERQRGIVFIVFFTMAFAKIAFLNQKKIAKQVNE
jgi:O-antigen ligase